MSTELRKSEPVHDGSGGDARLLAMFGSETSQHLSSAFLVFRDEPAYNWRNLRDAVRVDLAEAIPVSRSFARLELHLGTASDQGGTAYLHTLLRLASRHAQPVLDIQIPAPPPPGGSRRQRWTSVGIAIPDGGFADLVAFLLSIEAVLAPQIDDNVEILVRVSPSAPPRALWGVRQRPTNPLRRTWVASRELDVIPLESVSDRNGDTARFVAATVCAPQRAGVEADIFEELVRRNPGLLVRGVIGASILGTSVMFILAEQTLLTDAPGLLVYQGPGCLVTERKTTAADLTRSGQVALSQEDSDDVLLRIVARYDGRRHRTTQTLLSTLVDSLRRDGNATLASADRPSLRTVQIEGLDGGAVTSRLVAAVPTTLVAAGGWSGTFLERIEKALREALTSPEDALARSTIGAVVDVELITADAEGTDGDAPQWIDLEQLRSASGEQPRLPSGVRGAMQRVGAAAESTERRLQEHLAVDPEGGPDEDSGSALSGGTE